ncbi:Mitochondrial distribution and morphology protein 35 [Pestalotiopsis sp. IQ-011]
MASSQDFKSTQEKVQGALVKATRTSNSIATEDLNFQRRSNPAAGEALDEASERLLALSTSLLKSATKGTNHSAPRLEDADDVDAHWTRIVDVIDTLLEKADTCLDEYTGLVKRKLAPSEDTVRVFSVSHGNVQLTDSKGSAPKKTKTYTALDSSMRRANILKPQNAFEVKPDNHDASPWKPLLTKKPHATVPLEDSIGTFNNDQDTIQHKHPYETEILNMKYPDAIYQVADPIKYQPVETTAAIFVNTFEGVLEMLEELKKAKEIAIDTEHHDFRTYSGLLSLMQISTRDQDWIVDTLQPWRQKLEVLNEVFADPSIIKVLHGAYMDIIWLQRDCGLYIVGLFDTFHAADALGYPTRSLAYLLKRFVDFDADKKYQLADWRIRPIPEEMFYYARSDTHYLLYVYDLLRNELNRQSNPENPEENIIENVLERSKDCSLRRYEKATYDAESGQGPVGWFNMIMKQSSGNFSREQFAVFRAVHKWRDELARAEDESPMFIMSNQSVFDISRRLPPDPKALLSLVPYPSGPLKKRISELFKIVEQAKADGEHGPSLTEFFSEKARANTTPGSGAAPHQSLPSLKTNGKADKIVDTEDLVSEISQLWGEVPMSSRWELSNGMESRAHDTVFALPWAAFMENVSVAEAQSSAPKAPAASAPKAKATSANGIAEEAEFTLKQGQKRKATEPIVQDESSEENSLATPSTSQRPASTIGRDEISFDDEISMADSSDEERERRKAAKEARKREKRERKEAKAEAEAAEQAEEEAPFDYSQAKSVLNAKRSAPDAAKGGKAKYFNPYASLTAEGPKPARRMHGEKPGKSATIKKL